MRIWSLAVALAVGCKGKPKRHETSGSATPTPIDWNRCVDALANARAAPLDARPQIVIDGCRVCGDWKPVLAWNRPVTDGGPKAEEIEAAMTACDAFCTGDAKMKFMAALDKARGTSGRGPWRQLAASCKANVGAVPDDRFMSAPYFALDRIARAASAHGSETQAKLAALELPLPVLTTTGEGPVLPAFDHGVSPTAGDLQITVLGEAIYVGKLPRARLAAAGVQLQLGPTGYPGEAVTLDGLAPALTKLVGNDKTQKLMLLAPHAMPAQKLVPVIASASTVGPVYLAASALESPEGWQLPGAIPVALQAGGDQPIVVTPEMTVANLAATLVEHGAQNQPRIGVTAK